jgi:Calcineurin-like phosphoesterase
VKAIGHYETPHLALFKSAVSRVLAGELGLSRTNAAAIDAEHPLMAGADRYCRAMQANAPVPEPDSDRGDDPAVQAYLASLYHRKAHAHIGGDAATVRAIARQTARFKFGNPLWQQMYVQYYRYYWQYPWHKGCQPKYRSWKDATGGGGDANYGVIPWRLPAGARVAVVGDVGTGTDEAAAVLLAALACKPHAILHLGDVYFSGTRFETRHRLVGLVRSVMRSVGRRVPFFTIPGNHEYFTGAISYLEALDSEMLVDLSSQSQKASYFCLRSDDDGWQFLGMDTGYYGHYMNVAGAAQQATLERLHIGKVEIGQDSSNPYWPRHRNPYFAQPGDADLPQEDPTVPASQVTVRADEAEWHADKLRTFPGRSVLLSHHQLYSALGGCGVAQRQAAGANGQAAPDPTDFNRLWVDTALWAQFGEMFDRVAAWIWGHEHNLNIFQSDYRPAGWPAAAPGSPAFSKTLSKGRCLGHGAIPVQVSEAPYAQKCPVPLERAGLTLGQTDGWYNHGFQLLELAGRGKPARSSYYQVVEADPTPQLLFEEDLI